MFLVFTAVSFYAFVPQLVELVKNGEAGELEAPLFLVYSVSQVVWVVMSWEVNVINQRWEFFATMVLSQVLLVSILFLIMRYKRRDRVLKKQ